MFMEKSRVAVLAIVVGLIVFVLKVIAFVISDSVALLSDAMESIVNIVASIMMFIALSVASRPEDANHEYGHQKAENISAMVEGLLIIIAAAIIVEATIGRLLNPIALENINISLLVSLSATSLNAALGLVMMRVARSTGSIALEGDAKHLFSDVLSSGGVVLGLFIASVTGFYIIDPLIALVVATILVRMGIGVLRKTFHDLMDSSCEEEEKIILEVLDRSNGFLEYHDLKTRKAGRNIYMEVHICLQGKATVSESQALIDRIEGELKTAIPSLVPNIRIEDETKCKKQKTGTASGDQQAS